MTSQIALLNPDGVAVASDSAVSIGERTYSKTKIYQLAGRQPVGFMTCGTGTYRRISFSNIFGQFRSYFGQKYPHNAELPSLTDYVEELRKFLLAFPNTNSSSYENEIDRVNAHVPTTAKNISSEEKQDFLEELQDFTELAFRSLWRLKQWNQHIASKDSLDPGRWRRKRDDDEAWASVLSLETNTVKAAIKSNLRADITRLHSLIIANQDPDNWSQIKKQMSQKYSSLVNEFISQFISEHSLPKTAITRPLREILYHYLSDINRAYHPTTIAIFGFGEKENNPSLICLGVGLWRSGEDSVITKHDYDANLPAHYKVSTNWNEVSAKDNEIQHVSSCIETLAMSDEMTAILKGYHPKFEHNITKIISENIYGEFVIHVLRRCTGIGSELTKRFEKEFHSDQAIYYLRKNLLEERLFPYASRKKDFQRIIRLLPIDELANFAETMVDIESKITHLSKGVRKVGGQTDVATITKQDGFLWVKSKTRVDYSLNPRQAVQRDSASLK